MSRSFSPASQKIVVKKRRRFVSIPDDVFQRTDLSDAARLAALWMSGRPDEWEFRVWHICKTLGWGDAKWKSVRKELIDAKYFRQKRLNRSDGAFEWLNEFTDTPGDFGDGSEAPPVCGNTISGTCVDGSSIDAGTEDRSPCELNGEPTTTTTSRLEEGVDTSRSGGIDDALLEEIIQATSWDQQARGRASPTPGFWLFLERRLRSDGPNRADLAVRDSYRNAMAVEEARRVAALAETEQARIAAVSQAEEAARRTSAIAAFDGASNETQAAILAQFAKTSPHVFNAVAVGRRQDTPAARAALARFIVDHPESLLAPVPSAGTITGLPDADGQFGARQL